MNNDFHLGSMLTHDQSAPPLSKFVLGNIYSFFHLQQIEGVLLNRSKKYIVGINYHDVKKIFEQNFTFQLKYFFNNYEIVDQKKLDAFLLGNWPYKKPGVMLHFDDGFRSHYDVVAPALDRFGFTGWFHIITECADNLGFNPFKHSNYESMNWYQIKDLAARGHEICSHTCSHKRMKESLNKEEIEYEVLFSFERITRELGKSPGAFCWPGGEIDAYDRRAMKLIMSNYRYAFPSFTKIITTSTSPYAITRCNIEASWPIASFLLSKSFFWELKHKKKSAFYNKMIAEL
jgi:peptidoglycan/xylan/chitin deacetylase (PgdA/CDA1 family)